MTSLPVSHLPVRVLPIRVLPVAGLPFTPPAGSSPMGAGEPNLPARVWLHLVSSPINIVSSPVKTRQADLRRAADRRMSARRRPAGMVRSALNIARPFVLILLISVLLTAALLLTGGAGVQPRPWQDNGWLHGGLLTGMLGLWWQIQRLTVRQARDFGLARSDELTGLPNRRALNEQLHALLNARDRGAQALPGRGPVPGRGQQVWSVLLIDVDHFKAVNDTHGHLAGDEVLKTLTTCLRQELRADDVLGRWGGEEFLALLPATGFEGALVAAERLRRAVSLRTFPYVGSLTVSVGVASCLPGDHLDRVVARADAGMYIAKRSGRNRVAFSE